MSKNFRGFSRPHSNLAMSPKKFQKPKFIILGGLLIAVVCLPRIMGLTYHWSSDETTWLNRSHSFATALQQRDFADTSQSYHPGVTTMWIGALAIWRDYGKTLSIAPNLVTQSFLSPELLARARLLVALITALTILLAGLLLQRLLGNTIALVGILFLALDPFFLAESRRLHNDALATGFLMLTLFWWFCYLEDEHPRRRDLILSGISFGLACLSKSLAGAFLFFLPLLLMWYVKQCALSALRVLWGALLWVAIALLTVLSLWPYLWTWQFGHIPMFPLLLSGAIALAILASRQHGKSSTVNWSLPAKGIAILAGLGLLVVGSFALNASSTVLGHMYKALTTPHEIPQLFLGRIGHAQSGLYYPVYWFVLGAPLTVPLIVFAGWQLWRQRREHPKTYRVGVALLLFGVFYLLGLTLVAKKIPRYLVISFPPWDVLAAIGTVSLIRLLRNFVKKPIFTYAMVTFTLFFQAAPVLSLHPNYRAYYHPLIPASWIVKNISQGGGMGLDFAAQYLNGKPNAEQLTTYVTPLGGFLEYYFNGHTRPIDTQTTLLQSDYVVVYIRDQQIGWVPQTELFQKLSLEHVVRVNGVEYAWIYRANESIHVTGVSQ